MLHRLLDAARFLVVIPILCILVSSLALMIFETVVVAGVLFEVVAAGSNSPSASKALAAGLIESIDIFLIAIVAYIMSMGLYVLFVDEKAPLPGWLMIRDLDDLKTQLVNVIVAVLAVLFLQEIVQRAATTDLLQLALAIAVMIGVLTLFLKMKKGKED